MCAARLVIRANLRLMQAYATSFYRSFPEDLVYPLEGTSLPAPEHPMAVLSHSAVRLSHQTGPATNAAAMENAGKMATPQSHAVATSATICCALAFPQYPSARFDQCRHGWARSTKLPTVVRHWCSLFSHLRDAKSTPLSF